MLLKDKMIKKLILNIRPAFLSIYLINLFYGNSFNRRKIINLKKYNINLFVDPFNFLGIIINDKKIYEYKITKYIYKNLNKNAIFFDIGCNEGYYTILASKKNFNGKTYSFEPVKSLIKIIKKNLSINKIQNCKIYNFAIGEKDKMSKINIYHDKNIGSSSIMNKYRFSNKTQKIQIKSLDSFYKRNKFNFKIDLVKIDVEGYEINVLNGMMNLINKKKINKILVEYHFNIILKNELRIIENKIIKSGYKKKSIDKDCVVYELN